MTYVKINARDIVDSLPPFKRIRGWARTSAGVRWKIEWSWPVGGWLFIRQPLAAMIRDSRGLSVGQAPHFPGYLSVLVGRRVFALWVGLSLRAPGWMHEAWSGTIFVQPPGMLGWEKTGGATPEEPVSWVVGLGPIFWLRGKDGLVGEARPCP